MNIRVIGQDELGQWHSAMLRSTNDALTIIMLFGGDRLLCCDEAVVAETDGQIVSVASIAPEGEGQHHGGHPAIVGLYTLKVYRRRGIALQVMQAAIERCLKRGLTPPIHVDILSKGAKHLLEKLPEHGRQHLALNDQSGFVELI